MSHEGGYPHIQNRFDASERFRRGTLMDIGLKYDRIAEWWHEKHKDSDYGVAQISRDDGRIGLISIANRIRERYSGKFARRRASQVCRYACRQIILPRFRFLSF